ncbi:putative F-box protein At5g60060, partial [Syzygium oleosum]|uniref:putative F-box protein At5g60060 n=1 Tax=Syzygium oleosum TaxID=219896 RepID=UPI0024B9150E
CLLLLLLLLPATSAIARAENAGELLAWREPGKPPWSDLPPEILSMIGDRLRTRMDVLRFRSVCSSFRSSIPPPPRDAPRFPLRTPRPFPLWIPGLRSSDLFLRESTVYALGTAGGGAAQWLLKLQESEELGHMRMISLFSGRRITSLPPEFPEVVDPVQSRIVEICREYTIDYGLNWLAGGRLKVKAVMQPDCVGSDLDQCSFYFVDVIGRLSYWKYGDENPIRSGDELPPGSGYADIAVYQGKVCVLDRLGSVWQFDSSFRLRRLARRTPPGGISPPPFFYKHLVVSGDDLYVVDIRWRVSDTTVSTALWAYRLDQQRGRWEEVWSLGGSAFFICSHCTFAVAAHGLDGCEGDFASTTRMIGVPFDRFQRERFEASSLPDRSHKRPGDFAVLYSPFRRGQFIGDWDDVDETLW